MQQAIDCGDLDKQFQHQIGAIVFGFWSMHYGSLLLLNQSDIPLHDLGFSPVVEMLWKNTNIYLDGYQWRPLSTATDSSKLFEKISSALFDDEINLLKT